MSELVVSGCDPPEILEPAEAALDGVAVFISLFVVADFLLRLDLPGMMGFMSRDAARLEESPDRIGIIALAGEELFDAGDETDAFFGHHTIGGIARCENQRPGRQNLSAIAWILLLRPPFVSPIA